MMFDFFQNFDWNSFWMNVLVSVIFVVIGIWISIRLIPYYTLKLIRKNNKKHIKRKVGALIQEICDFLDESPYRDEELNQEQLAIYTTIKDIKDHRFVGLVDMNVLNKIIRLKIFTVIVEDFSKLSHDQSFKILTEEKDRLKTLRSLLENIIEVHGLHVDEKVISDVSELCLEIRSFEIRFKLNNAYDDLIVKGITARLGVIGINDLAKIYQSILDLLFNLVNQDGFETEIIKSKN